MLINYPTEKKLIRQKKKKTIQIYDNRSRRAFCAPAIEFEAEARARLTHMPAPFFNISHWNFQITLLVMIDRIQLPKHRQKTRQKSIAG